MTQRVVFLDRESLPVRFDVPRCAAAYVEHAHTAPDEVTGRLDGATVAITNKVPLREPVLMKLPRLRLIAVAATGYDCVDLGFCRQRGIAVTNIRDYAVHTVPEHAFALILALRRSVIGYRALVASGAWQASHEFCAFGAPIHDLHGSVLGIVGHGSIGRATAALGQAFGMRVMFAVRPERQPASPAFVPLPDLLATADVVSLHCPLTPATHNLIGEAELRLMKRDAILINTARGGLVDESALARALIEGGIGGAGIDVLSNEPPSSGNVLLELDLPNLIVTPHVAWASVEAMQSLADQLTGNIDAWAAGTPRNLVS